MRFHIRQWRSPGSAVPQHRAGRADGCRGRDRVAVVAIGVEQLGAAAAGRAAQGGGVGELVE
jgi:hypothetical protein